MTTKEKIIRQSIVLLEKQHADLLKIWNARPLVEICELRKKAVDNWNLTIINQTKNKQT